MNATDTDVDGDTDSPRCVACDQPAVDEATAEVGESGNWIHGGFCATHLVAAKRYGRITAERQGNRGERVAKPAWAEDWQWDAPRTLSPAQATADTPTETDVTPSVDPTTEPEPTADPDSETDDHR